MMSTRPDKMSDDAARAMVAGLDNWTMSADGAAIEKTFQFKNFGAAFGFMSRAAITAEVLDLHPEWSNVYGKVAVRLTTHDVGGLSTLDEELARAMDMMATSTGIKPAGIKPAGIKKAE